MSDVDSGSPSLATPDYWWYRERAELLQRALSPFVPDGATILDVGSADGPSVGWLSAHGTRVAMDVDPRGLEPGDVCGSALDLPFRDGTFGAVAGFDVLEHCRPEGRALAEFARVLAPGGVLLLSVPAYQWAWTRHDDRNHHHRRYTRGRAVAAVRRSGFSVLRSSYMFAGTAPVFAAERLRTRFIEGRDTAQPEPDGPPPLPELTGAQEWILSTLTALDRRLIARWDLPFGSSVIVAARKPPSTARLGDS